MGLIFKDEAPKPVDAKTARTRVFLLSAPIALMGLFALVLLVHDGLLGGLNRQKATGLLSAAIVCGGLIALIFGINAKKMAIQAMSTQTADTRPPWLRRKAWVDGRIANVSQKSFILVWILVVFWCLALAVLSLIVLPPLMHRNPVAGMFAMILPAVGLAVFFFTLHTTLAWRRFGQSVMIMDHFPAALGVTVSGKIKVPGRMQPEHGWLLRMSCVQRQTTGATNNRQTTEKVLWREEKWLRAELPQSDPAVTTLPVYFQLPTALPESTASDGDGIHWKLEALATLRGPNFQAIFEVPVFKTAEPPASTEDQTHPHVIALDELRLKIQSHIQVRDLKEGGKEFWFPSGRNPGFGAGAMLIWLIWTGVIGLLILKGSPLAFVIVFSVMDLLMAAFVVDVCFRCSRVVIHQGAILVERSWFGFKKEIRIRREQVSGILAEIGATAGHALYYDLKARLPGDKEVMLAKNLRHRPEADWLAGQMSAALVAERKQE